MSLENYENNPEEYANRYSELNHVADSYLETTTTKKLINKYCQSANALTLDYGCGPGTTKTFLEGLGLQVEGVDINPYMIEKARQRDPSGIYELIRSGEISRHDGYYDLAYAGWSIVHVGTKSEIVKILREIKRVLRSGGTLIMVVNSDETYNREWTPLVTDFEINKNATNGSQVVAKFKGNDYVVSAYFWTEDTYLELLQEAGFNVVSVDKPLGTESDGIPWLNEKEYPYLSIFTAQKPNLGSV